MYEKKNFKVLLMARARGAAMLSSNTARHARVRSAGCCSYHVVARAEPLQAILIGHHEVGRMAGLRAAAHLRRLARLADDGLDLVHGLRARVWRAGAKAEV